VENLSELHNSEISSDLNEEEKIELAKQQEYEDLLEGKFLNFT